MAQHDYVISNGTGAAVRSDLNNALSAIVTQNSGSTEPTTTYAYQMWADTNAGVMKIRNGANSAWITLYQLDGEWTSIAFENGSAAAPSIYFKDSGTDTGFFSGGTDQVNIATAGTERVEWGTSEVVFNDAGNNYDFRVEGDTNANLLFVDASADAVGIGSSTPSYKFEVDNTGGSTATARLVGNDQANVRLRIQNTGSGGRAYEIVGGLNGANNSHLSIYDATAAATRLTITETGAVGIGTTAPSSQFSVGGGAGATPTISLDYTINNTSVASIGANHTSGEVRYNAVTNYFPTFYSSGSERARIDSSGRWLLGTSSESAYSRAIFAGRSDGNAAGLVKLQSTNSAPANGDTLGNLQYGVTGATTTQSVAEIYAARDGGTWTNNSSMPGRLVFSTTADGASSPTERMRVDSNGYVWIKQFSGTSPWDATSGTYVKFGDIYPIGATAQSNIVAIFNRNTTTGSLIETKYNGAVVGSISVTTTTTAYNTSSDYRLKENISAVTDGITRLQQLKPSRFNFIADPDKTVDGFIAHEVQAVVPEAINGEKDAIDDDGKPIYQGIDQSKLVPLLTAALQEAIGEIESLKARVAALESA